MFLLIGNKMKKPFKIAVSVLAVALSTNVFADNLLDVYRLAKDGDPTFLASEAGTLASSERVNQSMAGLLPQLSGSYSISKSSSDSSGTTTVIGAIDDPATPEDESQPRNSANSSDTTSNGYSLSLNQEIYNHVYSLVGHCIF